MLDTSLSAEGFGGACLMIDLDVLAGGRFLFCLINRVN